MSGLRLWIPTAACAAVTLMMTGWTQAARPSFRVQPPPGWVVAAPRESSARMADDAGRGLLYLLDDYQQRLSETSTERYKHLIYKITSQAGLDTGSEIKPEFDPSYEDLVFHGISIRREGRIIDALKPRDIKLIQPETELNEREYNGLVSALVFLNDLRVGDIVDYAYSINGVNPVMRGRIAGSMFLVGGNPTRILRRRVVWAARRPLRYRNFNIDVEPVINDLGGATEYVWQRETPAPVQTDDSTPGWFNPYPQVQIADFATWEDVAGWAVPLYKPGSSIAPELAQQILLFKGASPRTEDRLVAALRFVQDEVRYFAVEIGPYSNRPNPPSVVFKRRYGDCKDKSLLLVTLLNELGIEAYPALVNTRAQGTASRFQPSPFDFDHCIVKALYGGRAYWLDPTISLQRGTLENIAVADEGLALVLKEGSRDLEVIPRTPNDRVLESVNELYIVHSYAAPASLEVTTTFHNADADSQRYSLTRRPISEVGKDYLNYYAHTDASITAD